MAKAIRAAVADLSDAALAALSAACNVAYNQYKKLENTCGRCDESRADCFTDRYKRCLESEAKIACWNAVGLSHMRLSLLAAVTPSPVLKQITLARLEMFHRTLPRCYRSVYKNCFELFDPLF